MGDCCHGKLGAAECQPHREHGVEALILTRELLVWGCPLALSLCLSSLPLCKGAAIVD